MNEADIVAQVKHLGLPDVDPRDYIHDNFMNNYPWKGFIFCGGSDHLKKAGGLVKLVLRLEDFSGYIACIESWETNQDKVTHDYCRLLIITNIAKGLFFDNNFIQELKESIRNDCPVLLTSCHELDAFEKEVSPTTLSVIETFLLGKL